MTLQTPFPRSQRPPPTLQCSNKIFCSFLTTLIVPTCSRTNRNRCCLFIRIKKGIKSRNTVSYLAAPLLTYSRIRMLIFALSKRLSIKPPLGLRVQNNICNYKYLWCTHKSAFLYQLFLKNDYAFRGTCEIGLKGRLNYSGRQWKCRENKKTRKIVSFYANFIL